MVRDNLIGARFQKISIESLKFKDEDINNKLVAPTKLSKHFNTLLKWAEEGINGGIGDKKELLEFAGVEVLPSISFANSVLRAEIGFHQKHSMTLTNMMGIRFWFWNRKNKYYQTDVGFRFISCLSPIG